MVLSAAVTLTAYRAGPAVALALPVAAAVVALVFWRPMYGVYAAVLAVPLELLNLRLGGDAGLSPSEGLLLITAASAVMHFVAGKARPWGPPYVWFTAFVIITSLGILFADDTFIVAKIVLMWTAFMLASLLVASGSREDILRVLGCIALTGGVVGVIAATGTSDQTLVAGGTIATNRAEGTFAHPNVLAFCVILAAPVALALALEARLLVLKIVFAIAGALALAGLMLSLSRSGLVGGGVSLAVMLAWPRFRRYAFGLIILVAVFATFNLSSLQDSTELSLVGKRIGTLQSSAVGGHDPRFEIWRETPNIIIAHPYLGVGEGNFSKISPQYGLRDVGGEPYDHAHDLGLTIAAETGLIGLFVFGGFLVSVTRAGISALRGRHPDTFPAALAVVAALTGLFVTSLGEYPPRTNVIMALILLEVGALVGLSRLRRQDVGGAGAL